MTEPNETTRRRARRVSAMTLIELLVVVVILGIAAALVVPAMGTTNVLKVQGAIRTIVADITTAQTDAIAMQQGRAVMFDVGANSYRLVQVVGGLLNTANTMYDPSKANDQYIVSFNDKEFGGATITFANMGYPAGSNLIFDDMGTPVQSPSSNSPITGGKITITAPGSVHDIIIDGFTGRVTVRRVSGG